MSRRRSTPIVVSETARLPIPVDLAVTSVEDYLEGEGPTLSTDLVVINLCRSYQYLSRGYYVSLLADARGQRAIPSLGTLEAVANPYSYLQTLKEAGLPIIEYRVRGRRVLPRVIVPRADGPDGAPAGAPLIAVDQEQGAIRYARTRTGYREITGIFGRTLDEEFRRIARALFRHFPVPILRIRLHHYEDEEGWRVGQIFPGLVHQLDPPELELLSAELRSRRFVSRPADPGPSRAYRIACLWEPDDPFAPSDEETLEKFEKAATRQNALFEVIGKNDLDSVAEYDALFIRTTTAIDHYSFAFAQRADSLDIPVIDDPSSTIRCSNKVYLYELFRKNGLPTPRTVTISRDWTPQEVSDLGYPLIVKQPDGTFSAAVKRAEDVDELRETASEMFRRSPLLVVQEYIPTEFDWRVGVLEGRVLYACRYFMVKGHWQIVGKTRSGRPRYGKVEAVPLDRLPDSIETVALQAAALIGDGLYGIDVKEAATGPMIIEINDNPDIWVGEEDGVQRAELYDAIIASFIRRIQEGLGVSTKPS